MFRFFRFLPRAALTCVLGCAVIAGCSGGGSGSSGTGGLGRDQFVVSVPTPAGPSGFGPLFVADVNGNMGTRLGGIEEGGQPAISNDRRRIAFVSPGTPGALNGVNALGTPAPQATPAILSHITTVDFDGGNRRELPAPSLAQTGATLSQNLFPDFSRDGRRVVWVHLNRRSLDSATTIDFYTANADGTGLKRVPLPTFTTQPSPPKWARDGSSRIFFSRRNAANTADELFTVDADSGSLTRRAVIAANQGRTLIGASLLQLSPDGSRLLAQAIIRAPTRLDYELQLLRTDGTKERTLLQGITSSASFSPDGHRVLFSIQDVAAADPTARVGIINIDGTGERTLIPTVPLTFGGTVTLDWS